MDESKRVAWNDREHILGSGSNFGVGFVQGDGGVDDGCGINLEYGRGWGHGIGSLHGRADGIGYGWGSGYGEEDGTGYGREDGSGSDF